MPIPASLALVAPRAQRRPGYWPSTGFGGYRVHGRISDVRATWRSPAVLFRSRPGMASMWIGVQNADADPGFVLVGELFAKSNGQRGLGELFWSDNALHFRGEMLSPSIPAI